MSTFDHLPDVTYPPGEFMYMDIGLSGASDSRNSNWAGTTDATWSSILPFTSMIRS